MTDPLRIDKTTDAEVARIGKRIIEIFKEEGLRPIEVRFVMVMIAEMVEKELK